MGNDCFNQIPANVCSDKILGIQIFGENTKERCNPHRPKTPIAKELQKLIAYGLGVDPTMVEFFTFMGTCFYKETGVSAKITFDGTEVNVRAVMNINKYYGEYVDILTDGGVEISLKKTAVDVINTIKLRQKMKKTRRRYIAHSK